MNVFVINYNLSGIPQGTIPALDDRPRWTLDTTGAMAIGALRWFGTVCRCTFTLPDTTPQGNGFSVTWPGGKLRGITPMAPFAEGYEGDVLTNAGGCRPPEQSYEASQIVYRPLPITIRDINFYRGDQRWIFKHVDGFPLFDKFMRGQAVRHLLDEAVSLGANGVRVFFAKASGPNFGTWADLWPGRADYNYDAIGPFLQLLRDYGLTCELTHGDLQVVCPGRENQRRHFDRIWAIAAQFPDVALGEFCNEWKKNGLETAIVRKYPGMLLCGGSSLSDGPCYTPALDWSAHHANRAKFPYKALDAPNVTHHWIGWADNDDYPGVGRQPVVINETTGAAEADIPGSRTTNAEFFFQLGRMLSAFNGGTFHSDAGLYGELLGPTQRRCAEAFFRGISGTD